MTSKRNCSYLLILGSTVLEHSNLQAKGFCKLDS
ncbi:hypothetical protein AAZX31_04G124800 [Glycine max]